jgi:hypothetical protein
MITKLLFQNETHVAVVLGSQVGVETLLEMQKAIIHILGTAQATPEESYFAHLLLSEMMLSPEQLEKGLEI